ncbi:Vacuolar cation-transporting ATPase YPK9 [Nosema granulosis]|uniref:Cation-transporting ATPase n=1 Tax=Nosema granulosis TaxID=83296 RepID=A0A9P6GYR6_9MICR|nr:Vacuolar cation-transporting ATPase YPK9 [Nosema granulosis]
MGFGNDIQKSYVDIQGRKKTFFDRIYPIICVCTLGLFYMLCKYIPRIKIYLTTKECSLRDADCVIIRNKYKKSEFRDVIVYKAKNLIHLKRYVYKDNIRVIDTEYSRFIFDYLLNRFVVYNFSYEDDFGFETIYENRLRISRSAEMVDLREREILFGKNVSNLRLKSITEIIIDNTYSLGLIVNIFCVILWFNIEYKVYGSIIALMVLYGYIEENYSEIRYKLDMEKSQTKKKAKVLRGGRFVYTDSVDIYPGDLIYIEPCREFFCDAIVLRGDVIADESFLTGESVPICKSSSQMSVVYSGTSILKSVNDFVTSSNTNLEKLCRVKNLTKKKNSQEEFRSNFKVFENNAIGMVTVTGFKTARGQIMRDILNPKPVGIPFLKQAYKSIMYIVVISSVLSLFLSVYFKRVLNWSFGDNMIYTFDLFFTMASPALSTSLSVGIRLSSLKLINAGIMCNNVDRIYVAGSIDTAIFDKTGTLTSEGMEFLCIDNLAESINDIDNVDFLTRMGLSTCHSVYELDGKYSGDSLDVKMFIFSNSTLTQGTDNMRNVVLDLPIKLYGPFLKDLGDEEEMVFYQKETNKPESCIVDLKGNDKSINEEQCPQIIDLASVKQHRVDIVKTYEFSSDLRRLSVVVKHKDRNLLFCKGSPDVIGERLKDKPEDFDEKVREYSVSGYRVIAMGYRDLEASISRTEDETNLTFLCIIVFSNKLKPEAKNVISELKEANIKNVICTGDNILTAISVGKECGIIDNDTSVIFPIVGDNCQSTYDVEWVCLGEEDLVFDKVRLNVYKNNYDDTCEDFVVACEGKEYEFFKNTDNYNFILEKGAVFARFTPGQKKRLVEDLRSNGETTMFCGDGANDSGALSSADIGVALAQNEASLASSFFSRSLDKVPILIKEGRCAYVTSIARFKFVCMSYILAFASLAFLVLRSLFLSDIQTLHIDICIIVPFLYLISNFNRSNKLAPYPPKNTILGLEDLLPTFISLVVQIVILGVLSAYGKGSKEITEISKAGTLVFFVSAFQSVFNGVYLSDCTPHRESIRQNKKILIFSSIILFINIALLILSYFCYDFVNSYLGFYLLTDITNQEMLYILTGVFFSLFACFPLPYYISKIMSNVKSKDNSIENY